ALELGCGTGFFLLNLMQGDVIKKGSVTDLSPGMVEVALRNAQHLGLDVDGRVADAERIPDGGNTVALVVGAPLRPRLGVGGRGADRERIPYDENTFDLVVGHAVLPHIPDVAAAMKEVL